MIDCACDYISGREFTGLVKALHKLASIGQTQHCSLAPQRLGDQKRFGFGVI